MKSRKLSLILAGSFLFVQGGASAPFNPPPEIDAFFAGDGLLRLSLDGLDIGDNSIAVGRDGSFVSITNYSPLANLFHLQRVLRNGTPDPAFDGDGFATATLGGGETYAYKAGVQPDLKPVVQGVYTAGARSRPFVLRFKLNGSLDAAFQVDGVATPVITNDDVFAGGFALQPDGKIVAAYYSQKPGGNSNPLHVIRLLPNGELDPAFGNGGTVTHTIRDDFYPVDIAMMPGGRILVAGVSFRATTQNDFAAVCLLPNGALDTAFGSGGFVRRDFTSEMDTLKSVAVLDDGRFFLAGEYTQGGVSRFVLARFLPNGAKDSGFGSNGIAVATGSENAVAGKDILLQRDGKAVISGGQFEGGIIKYTLWRFSKKGTSDTSFGPDGRLAIDFGRDTFPTGTAMQKDGRIIAAGNDAQGPFAVRVQGGPHLADARVGKSSATPTGDGVYGNTGAGATQDIRVRQGETQTLYFAVQNDGPGTSAYTLFATPGNADFRVRYFLGDKDVTADLALNLFSSPKLKPGALLVFRVEIRARVTFPLPLTLDFNAFSQIDNTPDLSRINILTL